MYFYKNRMILVTVVIILLHGFEVMYYLRYEVCNITQHNFVTYIIQVETFVTS